MKLLSYNSIITNGSYKFLDLDFSSAVYQLPLEKLFGISRLSVFLLRQHRNIYCSADHPLEPIYSRRNYSCLFDVLINLTYFEDLLKLEDREFIFI